MKKNINKPPSDFTQIIIFVVSLLIVILTVLILFALNLISI